MKPFLQRTLSVPGKLLPALVLLAMSAAPGVQACAVCFGKTDSPLGKGLHWGVLALLGFVFFMLAAFGAFAVYLARRAVIVQAEEAAEESRAGRG